ncbi:interleukin-21 receptor [Halichoeres trimaculatus]|uniref:interleukin-21 receptor n=1 Tax=Halichoeres trimaculatus TaxID=147232 RepID=UPI003D9E9A67
MMSGPCDMRVWCSALRPLMVSLLIFTAIVSLRGNTVTATNHSLQCVSDYVSLINCSLNIQPPPNSSSSDGSYWLTVTEHYVKQKFECRLVKDGADHVCSVKIYNPMTDDDYDTSDFMEQDIFNVSLCHGPNDGECEGLTSTFKPCKNVKPNPPCCLTWSHQSGQHHFTWRSTYEKYSWFSPLSDSLMYQLRFQKRGDEHKIVPYLITTDRTNFSVDDQKFLADTEYSARVRSSPNQAFFKGQWSSWSSEVHWRTPPSVNDDTFMPGLGKKIFIALTVMVPFVLVLCYAPFRKWRQSSFIPNPAPYFHTLYQDCHGDFKSWVVTPENAADVLEAEETLRIDALTKCAEVKEKKEEVQEEKSQHRFVEGSTYSNITYPGCNSSLLGLPYAVSTMSPLLDPRGSLKSLTFSSPPGSPTEMDSGCWLSSHSSLERDAPWYGNEYCTLTAFQQIGPVMAVKPCATREELGGCAY